MTNATMKSYLWWVCLVVSPLILVVIELFHPAGFTLDPGMYEYLSNPEHHTRAHKAIDYFGPQWWFALHMIQTPLVCLVAVGLWIMLDGIDRHYGLGAVISVWLAHVSTFLFVIYYTVLDSIGGIGLGRTITITEEMARATDNPLTPEQVEGVTRVLDKTWVDPWVGGVGSFASETGSYAILAAAIFSAVALFQTRNVPWPPLLVLLIFGWELQLSHASFHGPIAFALLAVCGIWLWRYRKTILIAHQGPESA